MSSISKALIYALLLTSTTIHGQTTSRATSADDSSSPQTTATPSIDTVEIDGTSSTYSVQFTIPASADVGENVIPNVLDPQAVDAQTVCPGYKASDLQRNPYGFTAILTLAGEPCNVYGTDIESLSLAVEYQSKDRVNINIVPANIDASNSSHYILPETLVEKPRIDSDANSTVQDIDLQITWSNDPSFSFAVIRRSTGDVLFDSSGSVLVFENQFIEFVSSLPEDYNLYGLGEHIHGLRLGNNWTATLYAADIGDPIDYNLYGSHPFYLDTRYFAVDPETGNRTYTPASNASVADDEYESYSHGVYLRNAHGQEIVLKPENITWRTIGGSIDLYFFDGPTQPEVTKQYQEGAIGYPAMQQYFTFGYHQCRWGYANWSQLQEVVDNFKRFDIPLENIWTDIDYMQSYRDFTNDPPTFSVPEGQQFLARLHANGQHYIPIVDSAIYIPNPDNGTDDYPPYYRGHDMDVWMHNPDGSEYIGAVWPGYTVFPDWHSTNSVAYWTQEMALWYDQIPFDGIWIDMSEVSSFCVGSCGTGNLSLNPVHPPFGLPGEVGSVVFDYPEGFNLTNATEAASASAGSSSQASMISATSVPTATRPYFRTTPTAGARDVDHPPYAINNVQGDLAVHAISPNATHADGVLDYDVHNLFGHQILNATYQALLNVFPGKRPFIIGRSTFAGSGKYAGHWGGDNSAKWAYMYFSIPQALSFSLFGFPMFGVDTCGFNGNSDEELCNRWMQLSAFFPFYRNHNTLSTIPQEPYIWSSVASATRTAISVRYSLLPYIYTLFHASHTTGSAVMRALAWEFPNDPTLANADHQFLLGTSLLVTPVLEQGATSVRGVFPGAGGGDDGGTIWYDWYNQTAIANLQKGENRTIDAPLGHIPLFVRGGSVIPMQKPGYTTKECRQGEWSLLVALDVMGTARGELYVDDGESLVQNATLEVSFVVQGGALSVSARGGYVEENRLANVTVMGVQGGVGDVKLGGSIVGEGVEFEEEQGLLKISGLQNYTGDGAWMRDWILSWSD
ncbi:glycoside hydrolase family 31 protein [Aulographum hederae CBS 113979]|uniref:alpha-glucosidase n=1 Tax=Aulographum hederae CBS 113979 TaxID=1176131 RepID=A0A6G1GX64_9PEZI|nr:glycoside hydrolase family 31 protein [Aulographum hederae CBS 113979]